MALCPGCGGIDWIVGQDQKAESVEVFEPAFRLWWSGKGGGACWCRDRVPICGLEWGLFLLGSCGSEGRKEVVG